MRPPLANAAVPLGAPALALAVTGASAPPAAVPTVALALAVESAEPVRSLALTVAVRIAAPSRSYDAATRERLADLFGTPERWPTTLRALPWTQVALQVGPFERSTTAELRIACTYDFEVAAAKYLHALRDGDVPLDLLCSGSVFFVRDGRMLVAQVPWELEARFGLPVDVYREAMDRVFPGAAWLRLDRDVFDRLDAWRTRRVLPTWDAAVDALLDAAEGRG